MPVSAALSSAVALDPIAAQSVLSDNRRIIIVGAGGWIGKVLLCGLKSALGDQAFADRVVCFGSTARTVDLGEGATAAQRPLAEIGALPTAPSMLFHLAFLTKDKVAGMAQDAYIAANKQLSATVYDALGEIGVDRVFVASSGAAAFAEDKSAADDLRLYGRLKRDDEELFARWAEADHNRRAVITRIYSVSGPFINKHETYALASFILDALAGKDVAVHAPMPVLRSYVPIRQLMSLALSQLTAETGPQSIVYDTGGEPMELAEVAGIVAETFGVAVARAAITNPDANRYVGDSASYSALLTQFGVSSVPLKQQIEETAITLSQAA